MRWVHGGLGWWRFINELLCGVQFSLVLVEMALDGCFNCFDVMVDGR